MKECTLQKVYDVICQKVDNIALTNENIKKLLTYELEITCNFRQVKIRDYKIFGYGIDEPYPPMTFKEYIPHFKDACEWGIAAGGSCETPEKLWKKFKDLKLTYEVEKMNVEEIYNKMTEEEKKEMIKFLEEEENEKLFKEKYDYQEAIIPSYEYHPCAWDTDACLHLDDSIWEHCPVFAGHSFSIGIKWVTKYDFTNCLEHFGNDKVQKAIKKAIPDANIIIVTPAVLDKILIEEIKTKIVEELLS